MGLTVILAEICRDRCFVKYQERFGIIFPIFTTKVTNSPFSRLLKSYWIATLNHNVVGLKNPRAWCIIERVINYNRYRKALKRKLILIKLILDQIKRDNSASLSSHIISLTLIWIICIDHHSPLEVWTICRHNPVNTSIINMHENQTTKK